MEDCSATEDAIGIICCDSRVEGRLLEIADGFECLFFAFGEYIDGFGLGRVGIVYSVGGSGGDFRDVEPSELDVSESSFAAPESLCAKGDGSGADINAYFEVFRIVGDSCDIECPYRIFRAFFEEYETCASGKDTVVKRESIGVSGIFDTCAHVEFGTNIV